MRFEEPPESDNEIWKMPHQDQTLHFATGEHATVLYRNGNEVVENKQKLGKRRVARGSRARDLETWGTFGPIPAYVLMAAATGPSTLSWKRRECGKDGDVAVFSYRAASSNIVPEITHCCHPEGDGTTLYQNKADTYGEFALNPDTKAIMRIVINADLDQERDPDVPLIRSQVMVEYGPEELGGNTYIRPLRSVEISRGRSERILHEWGCSDAERNAEPIEYLGACSRNRFRSISDDVCGHQEHGRGTKTKCQKERCFAHYSSSPLQGLSGKVLKNYA